MHFVYITSRANKKDVTVIVLVAFVVEFSLHNNHVPNITLEVKI